MPRISDPGVHSPNWYTHNTTLHTGLGVTVKEETERLPETEEQEAGVRQCLLDMAGTLHP